MILHAPPTIIVKEYQTTSSTSNDMRETQNEGRETNTPASNSNFQNNDGYDEDEASITRIEKSNSNTFCNVSNTISIYRKLISALKPRIPQDRNFSGLLNPARDRDRD